MMAGLSSLTGTVWWLIGCTLLPLSCWINSGWSAGWNEISMFLPVAGLIRTGSTEETNWFQCQLGHKKMVHLILKEDDGKVKCWLEELFWITPSRASKCSDSLILKCHPGHSKTHACASQRHQNSSNVILVCLTCMGSRGVLDNCGGKGDLNCLRAWVFSSVSTLPLSETGIKMARQVHEVLKI